VQGIPQLLEAIEKKLESDNLIKVNDRQRVVVTAGGNMGFMNAVLAVADVGDEFILPKPYYFNHEMAITMAGCRPVLVECEGHNYEPSFDAISEAITKRTRAVVTISPNNPTGAVYREKFLAELNWMCKENGIYHIHDEAYEYFTWDAADHFSPAQTGSEEQTISLFSLSKSYGFASWRIGYMLIPEHLFDAVRKIQDTILICPPVISQYAALGAMREGRRYCKEMIKPLVEVRRQVAQELAKLGELITVAPAKGAFYFFMKVNTAIDSMTLVERLIKEHSVAVMPGTTFGMNDGCYLRIAYAALGPQTVAEGVGRFVRGIKAIAGGS